MSAWQELQDMLLPDEAVEAIVFGPFGWGSGYGEPDPQPIPADSQGVLLTLEQARPLMQGWSFNGGFGAPECYAIRVWTNLRVMWVHEYDGATGLRAIERNPCVCMPGMDS